MSEMLKLRLGSDDKFLIYSNIFVLLINVNDENSKYQTIRQRKFAFVFKEKMIQIVCSYLFANRDAVAICIYNLQEVLFFKYKFANSIYP